MSAVNTKLYYKNETIVVKDNQSKFGTYIRTGNQVISPNFSYRVLNFFFSLDPALLPCRKN